MTCDMCNQTIRTGEQHVTSLRDSRDGGESLTTYMHSCCDTENEEYVEDRGDVVPVAWVCQTHLPPVLTLGK